MSEGELAILSPGKHACPTEPREGKSIEYITLANTQLAFQEAFGRKHHQLQDSVRQQRCPGREFKEASALARRTRARLKFGPLLPDPTLPSPPAAIPSSSRNCPFDKPLACVVWSICSPSLGHISASLKDPPTSLGNNSLVGLSQQIFVERHTGSILRQTS